MTQSPDVPGPSTGSGPVGDPAGLSGAGEPVPTSPTPAGRDSDPAPARTSRHDRREQKQADKAHDPLRSSRASGAYAAIIAFGIVLVLLIIFITQNTESAQIKFLGLEGSAPLAVLLLIGAAAGIFLTALAASMRLLQVRRRVKRERKS